jgi:ketosteroid isomerase-like protein
MIIIPECVVLPFWAGVPGGGISNQQERLMKLSTLYSCALLLFGWSSLANAGPKADIERLETEFNAAYAANDLDKYFGYYSDDAILWFPEGRTDIPAYKKEWTAFIKSGGKILACTMSDKHLRLSPQSDAAIASYLLHVKTQAEDKKVTDEVYQETDVWFKAAGGWKIAHVHYSLAAAATHK